MRIFDFEDYKEFVVSRIEAMPKRGHGQYLKISQELGVHSTLVSQIFKGQAHLTLEHALKLCNYFGLSDLETEYFMVLVQKEKAGTVDLKRHFSRQLKSLKEKGFSLGQKLKFDKQLDEKNQALFYSNWYFSGIRLLTSIPEFQTRDALAQALGLSLAKVNRVVDFLLSVGLCVEEKGKLEMGTSSTFLIRESPLASRHHTNWRLKSMQKFDRIADDEFVFTNPVTISKKDFHKIREELLALIEKFRVIVSPSVPEILCTLNIDWTRVDT